MLSNLINMHTVISRLEARIARLEQAVATGEVLQLTPREEPAPSVWWPNPAAHTPAAPHPVPTDSHSDENVPPADVTGFWPA